MFLLDIELSGDKSLYSYASFGLGWEHWIVHMKFFLIKFYFDWLALSSSPMSILCLQSSR